MCVGVWVCVGVCACGCVGGLFRVCLCVQVCMCAFVVVSSLDENHSKFLINKRQFYFVHQVVTS